LEGRFSSQQHVEDHTHCPHVSRLVIQPLQSKTSEGSCGASRVPIDYTP
jgi:hypothetical protein